jgi:Secretin and TonB N terminus short domain
MIAPLLFVLLLSAPPPPSGAAPPRAAAAEQRSGTRRAGDWPAQASDRRVTLQDDTSVDDALKAIGDAAGWNLVIRSGAQGDRAVAVRLRDVPVEEALEAVLEGTSLIATRRGQTVTIASGRAGQEPGSLFGGMDGGLPRFSGDFQDEPVDAALRKLADTAGLSVVFPPGVKGTVSGHFKDAALEDVLRAVLDQAGLVARRRGSILEISREPGRATVIAGGKRFSVSADLDDVEPGPALDDREGDDAPADAGERRPGRGHVRHRAHGGGRVLRGDQVIGPGERASEVVVLGGSVRLAPNAGASQVTAILGSVDLGPGVVVDGEVVAIGGDVHVSPGARIGGNAVSIGGKIVIDQDGLVEGQQTSIDVPGLGKMLALAGVRSWSWHVPGSTALSLAGALARFAVFFALGLLLLAVVPRRLETVSGSMVQSPFKAVLSGLLGTLAIPVAAVLLAITVVGIPLIAVLVLAVVVAGVMGYAALALFVGRALPLRVDRGTAILQLAIGTAILVAIGEIPVLGFLAWLAAWMLVFGVVLRTRFGRPPTVPPVYGTTAPPPMPGAPPATAPGR